MRVRLPRADSWSKELQDQLNGEIERSLERLNEYALVPYGGTAGQSLVKASDRPYDLAWGAGSGGSVTAIRGACWSAPLGISITNTQIVTVYCPRAGTIARCTVIADAVGSAVIDVRKTALAGLPAGPANTIVSGVQPTLSGQRYLSDSTLTGWTTSIAAGDVLSFALTSCSGIKNITIQLSVAE